MTTDFRPPIPPRFAARAAIAMRAALLRIADRIVPPQMRAIELALGHQSTTLLHAAARLELADRLARGGPKTAAELAREIGNLDPDALHRVMRALAAHGVFDLDDTGRFRNNRTSETLRAGIPGSTRACALYFGSKSNLAAWSDLERTIETGKNAFERIHQKDCWRYFAEHPDEGRVFDQAMVDLTDLQAPAIAASYPFSNFEIICDVAGGRGTLLAAILSKHSGVRGWLVDEPHVLEQAGALLASRGVAARVDRKPGNMFVEVPRGADAYVLKDILHDWDDDRSQKILESCRRAMGPGQRVLVVEVVVEPTAAEQPGTLLDAHMMVVCCEGRQRSIEDFRRLFAKAGFRLERIVATPMPASVVEAVAV